jgi:hypothetical protein
MRLMRLQLPASKSISLKFFDFLVGIIGYPLGANMFIGSMIIARFKLIVLL